MSSCSTDPSALVSWAYGGPSRTRQAHRCILFQDAVAVFSKFLRAGSLPVALGGVVILDLPTSGMGNRKDPASSLFHWEEDQTLAALFHPCCLPSLTFDSLSPGEEGKATELSEGRDEQLQDLHLSRASKVCVCVCVPHCLANLPTPRALGH